MGVNGVPDENRKGCFDCIYCQGALSWWCVNKKAIADRGTKIPGVIKCPHWEPMVTKEQLYEKASLFSKLTGNYTSRYIEIDLSNNGNENG